MIDELRTIKGKDVPAVCFRADEGEYIFSTEYLKEKIKTEGEFVMLGRKSGAGNPLLHDFFVSLFGTVPDRPQVDVNDASDETAR